MPRIRSSLLRSAVERHSVFSLEISTTERKTPIAHNRILPLLSFLCSQIAQRISVALTDNYAFRQQEIC